MMEFMGGCHESHLHHNGEVKAALFQHTDGGGDQAPRGQQALANLAELFLAFGLDGACRLALNPHQPKGNPIERRFAPASKEFVMLVLPHDNHGNHDGGWRC